MNKDKVNKVIFLLLRPEGWDESRCRICGWPLKQSIEEGCTSDSCSMRPVPEKRADSIPDYSSPADHRELELWLCKEENHKFCRFFSARCFHQKYKHLYVDDMGIVNTTHFLPFILKDLPSLLFDFLGTEEAQESFGWEECICPDFNPNPKDINCLNWHADCCCKNSHRMAPWLQEMRREDA